jgi:pantetheine-phosphate adenylyltransferase
MNKEAVFPGSFDPLTLGHSNIIQRAARLFDKVHVAIGTNTTKPRHFPVDLCEKMISATFKDNPKVDVLIYDNLTVDLCKELNIRYIIRGIRNVGDFEFERSLAEMNRHLAEGLDTIFFNTRPKYSYISSTIIRELLKSGGDISKFVPPEVLACIV